MRRPSSPALLRSVAWLCAASLSALVLLGASTPSPRTAEQAFASLDRTAASYGDFHITTHALALELIAQGHPFEEVARACVYDYTYGCNHAVASALVAAYGSFSRAGAVCEANLPHESAVQCWHGVGHAAAEILLPDLPASLAACRGAPDQERDDNCQNAVFMETFTSAVAGRGPTGYLDLNRPNALCESLDTDRQTECFRARAQLWFQLLQGDTERVAALCAGSPAPYQLPCAHSLGSFLWVVKSDARAVSGCDSITLPAMRRGCFSGIEAHPEIPDAIHRALLELR